MFPGRLEDEATALQLDLRSLDTALRSALQQINVSESIVTPRDLLETIHIIIKLAEEDHGGSLHSILKEDSLWSLIDQIEARIEYEEIIVDIELQIQEELSALERAIFAERDAAVEEMLATPPSSGRLASPGGRPARNLHIIQDDAVLRRRCRLGPRRARGGARAKTL